MIECPYGPCTKKIPMAEAVGHLKVDHKAKEYKQNGSGVVRLSWLPGSWIQLGKQGHCSPAIATYDDCTLFLHAYSGSRSWEFWVTHLGGEKQAQKCEVKMVSSHKELPTSITFQGKVYGSDTNKVDFFSEEGKDGVLELSTSLMKKIGYMHEGKLKMPMTYELIRK